MNISPCYCLELQRKVLIATITLCLVVGYILLKLSLTFGYRYRTHIINWGSLLACSEKTSLNVGWDNDICECELCIK